MAYKTRRELMKQLISPNLKRHTKCMLSKALVRSILTHGSGCLHLLKEGRKYAPNLQKKNIKNDLQSS
jgi:hypothetical protein